MEDAKGNDGIEEDIGGDIDFIKDIFGIDLDKLADEADDLPVEENAPVDTEF